MKEWLKAVEEFNRDVVKLPEPNGPRQLSIDRYRWFQGVVDEEMAELWEGITNQSIGDQADAIIDLIYFALGRLYEMGIPAEECFNDVHKANLRKSRGIKDRTIQSNDDAIKPKGWAPPTHSWLEYLSPAFIEAARMRAKKSKDYKDAKGYFPFGKVSHAQMIWVKARRLMNIAKMEEPENEPWRDSLIDLLNYTSFAVEDDDGIL